MLRATLSLYVSPARLWLAWGFQRRWGDSGPLLWWVDLVVGHWLGVEWVISYVLGLYEIILQDGRARLGALHRTRSGSSKSRSFV